jgi:chloramphenicol 3-O-phosphotransferase
MILLLNGAFGVGKSTVARLLWQRLPGSRVYNPEWAGSVLIRLPLSFRGSGTDDFQDIGLWRKSVVYGTRLTKVLSGGSVIVPMAFSNREYLAEVVRGLSEFDDDIRIFCLKAGMPTIIDRLRKRGERVEDGDGNWSVRKARECVEAHGDVYFGESIETEGLGPDEVANEIMGRLDNKLNER